MSGLDLAGINPKESWNRQTNQSRAFFVMEADTPLQIGQRVKLLNKDPIVEGTVKYIGSVEFATGTWVGLELDSPSMYIPSC